MQKLFHPTETKNIPAIYLVLALYSNANINLEKGFRKALKWFYDLPMNFVRKWVSFLRFFYLAAH